MRLILPFTILTLISTPFSGFAEQLLIGGSGTDLATFRQLAEAFEQHHGHISIEVKPSVGSGGGIRAVKQGQFHLGLTSRPPKDTEGSPQLVFKRYARTPLVFAVSNRLNVHEISSQQVIDIYSGRLRRWPDGTPILPILRPAGDSDTRLLVATLDGFREALSLAYSREEWPLAYTDQQAAENIATLDGAIGTSTLAQIKTENRPLRQLVLDGRHPVISNRKPPNYPLHKSLYLVYQKDHDSPALQAFLDFMNSSTARQLLESTGHQAVR